MGIEPMFSPCREDVLPLYDRAIVPLGVEPRSFPCGENVLTVIRWNTCGSDGIRTHEDSRQQTLNLSPLTARERYRD